MSLGGGMEAGAAYLFTLVALVVGFLVYFYTPYWGLRNVPGPPTAPLVGHLPLLAKHGPDVFSILAKTYGPIYRYITLSLSLYPSLRVSAYPLWSSLASGKLDHFF